MSIVHVAAAGLVLAVGLGTGAAVTSGSSSPAPALGGASTAAWASGFLGAAGLPRTACNVAAVRAWEGAEGTFSRYNNPLDSTQREPGSYSINSVGVQRYVSTAQGEQAAVKTLFNGFYPRIIAAFRAGNSAQGVADAIASSPWGTQAFSVSC
jgi:hypothetical protein